MKIVFMGTPDFAVSTLQVLAESPHEIQLVVTGLDKPRGRGQKFIPTAVKSAAEELGIKIYQPKSLKSEETVDCLKSYPADLFVVVAFRILPESIIEIPLKGVINLHASLLPKYRGAAPIQWALLNGDSETGVTTFFIEKGVDTGDIILQKKIMIEVDDTAGTLHDRLSQIGAELVLQTVNHIEADTEPRKKQIGQLTKAPKITREHCKIDWTNSANHIVNQIRAFSPYPGAFTYLEDKLFKIYRARTVEFDKKANNGNVLVNDIQSLLVKAGDAWMEIEEIQQEGKKRMRTIDFLRGVDSKKLAIGFKVN